MTTSVCFQSWQGIEGVGLVPESYRPQLICAWFAYVSGPGIFPMICSRSRNRQRILRHPFAVVMHNYRMLAN